MLKYNSLALSFFFWLIILVNGTVFSQTIYSTHKYPLTNYRSPLDLTPPALAGSFGELRANHFHSGLDFRTNQQTGYPVFAIADGFISRLRIQNSGFGLALYLNHPDGFTSVYAHLERFAPKIAGEAKAIQYKNKSYEIDEFPNPDFIPVKRGDIIGYSGNTGSSGGPHLHFEIRDTKTEATINPQLLGIQIPDTTPPVISSMYVYRLDGKPFSEFTPKQYFQVIGVNGSYKLNKVSTIHLSGEVGFGIITTDRHNGASGLNGVYSIALEVDNQLIYTSALERFTFENSRAINAHIDYPALTTFKRSIQKSFVDPGNPLSIYYNLINNGKVTFNDGKLHPVKYTVMDAKGNTSVLAFNVLADPKATIPVSDTPKGTPFDYAKPNEFATEEVKVLIPKGTLYNSLNFVYKRLPKPQTNAYSAVHQIHNPLTPLHIGFEIAIKADSSLNALQSKALIVNTNRSSQGGYFENGFVKAKPRAFGSFFIAIDTIAPNIIPINIANDRNLKAQHQISFKIKDNLSGIKSFNGYINGKWVLMEYDAKSAKLWHTFDETTSSGKHLFELYVSDLKDNVKKFSAEFIR